MSMTPRQMIVIVRNARLNQRRKPRMKRSAAMARMFRSASSRSNTSITRSAGPKRKPSASVKKLFLTLRSCKKKTIDYAKLWMTARTPLSNRQRGV